MLARIAERARLRGKASSAAQQTPDDQQQQTSQPAQQQQAPASLASILADLQQREDAELATARNSEARKRIHGKYRTLRKQARRNINQGPRLSVTMDQDFAQAQREYDEVVARYKDTDQWLKAPNGNLTNLTERQWVQVRTPSFKAWFGDWGACGSPLV